VGVIRKTLSISTLGIVDFRSKKELLRRAEKARREAQAELIGEQAARTAADRRIAAAEKRARQAELTALQQAKRAETAKAKGRRGRKRRQGPASHVLEALEGARSAAAPIEERAKDLGRRGRKAALKAAKQAEAAAEDARKRARKQAKRTKEKLDEVGGAASDFVKDHR
jgi:hypothetical protein